MLLPYCLIIYSNTGAGCPQGCPNKAAKGQEEEIWPPGDKAHRHVCCVAARQPGRCLIRQALTPCQALSSLSSFHIVMHKL